MIWLGFSRDPSNFFEFLLWLGFPHALGKFLSWPIQLENFTKGRLETLTIIKIRKNYLGHVKNLTIS